MKQRSIAMMVILWILTFGIFALYWYCSFQNQLKKNTERGFGGFVHLIVTIFTFGIYYIYWNYAAGRRLAMIGAKDNSTMYLVLTFIGFSWLNMLLMQSQANQLSDRPSMA